MIGRSKVQKLMILSLLKFRARLLGVTGTEAWPLALRLETSINITIDDFNTDSFSLLISIAP